MGAATAADDTISNETVSTSDSVDALSQEVDSVDVMAQDSVENDNNVSDDTVNKLESSAEDKNILGASQSISKLIDQTKGGSGNFTLNEDYIVYRGDVPIIPPFGINITGDFVLDGNGHTIDGNNIHYGPLFYVYNGGNFILKNITIINFKGDDLAGVVGIVGTRCNVNISGTFINNTARYGAVVGLPLASSWWGNLTLNGTFINNTASKEGGVVYMPCNQGSTMNLNGNFSGNSAGEYGGVVYINGYKDQSLSGTVNLNGTFSNNSAGKDGGVVHISGGQRGTLNLDGTFSNNSANASGGVVSTGDVSGNVNLNGTFSNNTASSGSVMNTGNVPGNVNLNGTFSNNTASSGGIVNTKDVSGNVTLDGVFSGNSGNNIINSNNVTGNVTMKGNYLNNNLTGDIFNVTDGSENVNMSGDITHSLNKLIQDTINNGKNTVDLDDDSFLDNNLTINANITINGKGHIIKGNKYLFIHPSI